MGGFLTCQLIDEAFELPNFPGEILRFCSDFLFNDVVKEILVNTNFVSKANLSDIRGFFKGGSAMELFELDIYLNCFHSVSERSKEASLTLEELIALADSVLLCDALRDHWCLRGTIQVFFASLCMINT